MYGQTWENRFIGAWEPVEELPAGDWDVFDLEYFEERAWLNQFSPVPLLLGVPYEERNGTLIYAHIYDVRDTHDYWGWRYYYMKEFDIYTRKGSPNTGGIAPLIGGLMGLAAMTMLSAGVSLPRKPGGG